MSCKPLLPAVACGMPSRTEAWSQNGAPGVTRTPDLRFRKPQTPAQNSSGGRELRQGDSERAAPGAARHRPEAQTQHNNIEAQTPPDLDRVVAAWPALPQHIKAAVLALVKTTEV